MRATILKYSGGCVGVVVMGVPAELSKRGETRRATFGKQPTSTAEMTPTPQRPLGRLEGYRKADIDGGAQSVTRQGGGRRVEKRCGKSGGG